VFDWQAFFDCSLQKHVRALVRRDHKPISYYHIIGTFSKAERLKILQLNTALLKETILKAIYEKAALKVLV